MTAARKASEPAFEGLQDAAKEIDAARRFVSGILKRRHLKPEIVKGLNAILADIAACRGNGRSTVAPSPSPRDMATRISAARSFTPF